ncbi:MAG: metal ABC transporter permease [Syntrophomonadaceae bacterium]|jgi:zinc transport system permease protein
MDILQFTFMRNALMVGVLVSIACGVIGTYVVVKRIVFISGGISHTAYGGIGLGYYLGINPMLGAIAFTITAALGMGLIQQRGRQREDTIIGVIWAVGMAVGIIFVKISPGYVADLMSYLFGSILTVPLNDIWLILLLDILIISIVYRYFEEFKAVAFDEEFAWVSGLKTGYLNLILLFLVALTVVVTIRAVGIILVIALLTIPPAIAGEFSRGLKGMMILSVMLGVIFTTAGLYLSYLFDLPSGATIILVAAFFYIISLLLRK